MSILLTTERPFTPYCGLKLVELAQQFFPKGVVQVLSGDDNLGPWLTAHAGVDKISFTGSTATGKRVRQNAQHILWYLVFRLAFYLSHGTAAKFAETQNWTPTKLNTIGYGECQQDSEAGHT